MLHTQFSRGGWGSGSAGGHTCDTAHLPGGTRGATERPARSPLVCRGGRKQARCGYPPLFTALVPSTTPLLDSDSVSDVMNVCFGGGGCSGVGHRLHPCPFFLSQFTFFDRAPACHPEIAIYVQPFVSLNNSDNVFLYSLVRRRGLWENLFFFCFSGSQADGARGADGKADYTSRGQLDEAVEAPAARLAARERRHGRQNGKGKRPSLYLCSGGLWTI